MPTPKARRNKDGTTTWYVRLRDPRHSTETSERFDTLPEAERFCRLIAAIGPGPALDHLEAEHEEQNELTLDDWAPIHFSALTKPAADTVARYRRIYTSCWAPELGHLRLSQITRVDVARALNKIDGRDKTVENKWGVLAHMLKMAAQDGHIPKSPAIGVRPARRTDHETTEHRYLTHEEFWAILDATPDHWRPLVMMLAGTGMRWGELVALTVADVDAQRRTVRIVKAEKRGPDGGRIIGTTKSRKSRRTISLPVEVVDVLRPLLEGRPRDARLFTAPRGGPVLHRTFYTRVWCRKILADAQLAAPRPRIHDLRHSHVAWLIAAGTSPPVIQARLGHEKITTTIDTYGHLLPDLQVAAAAAANVVLAGGPKQIAAPPTEVDGAD